MKSVAFNWIGVVALVAGVARGGDGVVRLDGPAALAELRASNPTHYALATKIMAEANRLCKPTTGQLQHTQLEGKAHGEDGACQGSFLSTSNPPKRQITFTLDHTAYIATVTVTDDPPRLVAASSGR